MLEGNGALRAVAAGRLRAVPDHLMAPTPAPSLPLIAPADRLRRGPMIPPFTPLAARDAEWAYRLAMVQRARRFLYASTYFFQYDRYGREYADALLAACGRGVSVWLVIDGFGQHLARTLMNRGERARLAALFATLRRAGVHLVIYRAPRRLQRLLGSGLHIKVQIGDDGEAILASGNISCTSFEHWNEYAVALRGPIAAQLLEVLMGFIDEPDRSHLEWLRSRTRDRAWLPASTYCVAGCPTDDPSPLSPLVQRRVNPVTAELIRLIDGARRTLRITTFYFKPAPPLFHALERAARRGVEIEIHHSHRRALAPSDAPWIATTYYYRRCLELGMRLYENRHGEHSKIVVADDRWAAFGTYNLEHAADDRLAEVMVITGEPGIVTELHRFIGRLRRAPENVAVDHHRLAALPLAVKAKRLALYPFRRWV